MEDEGRQENNTEGMKYCHPSLKEGNSNDTLMAGRGARRASSIIFKYACKVHRTMEGEKCEKTTIGGKRINM